MTTEEEPWWVPKSILSTNLKSLFRFDLTKSALRRWCFWLTEQVSQNRRVVILHVRSELASWISQKFCCSHETFVFKKIWKRFENFENFEKKFCCFDFLWILRLVSLMEAETFVFAVNLLARMLEWMLSVIF